MFKLTIKKKLIVVLLGTIFLCLFIFNTDPHELSAPYLLVPPAVVLLTLYMLSQAVIEGLLSVSAPKRRIMSLILALGPVTILLLASLGQLTPRDAVLSLLLVGGLAFYASRARVDTA